MSLGMLAFRFKACGQFLLRNRTPLLGVGLIAVLVLVPRAPAKAQTDDVSILPFTSSDQVVVRKKGTQRTRTISGVIEDLSGQTLILRRSGNTVDVLKLPELVSIRFQKSLEFDNGLRKLQAADWNGALTALQAAAAIEPRKWVVREILASTARAQRALGQFEQCLTTIEKILDDDPASRHVVELPLVWDERLPAEQRIRMTAADLQAASPVRQLTAASALIHEPEHQAAATATLQALRKTARGQILELSEAQLWRARLFQPGELLESEVRQWSRQVRHLDRRARSGPEFVIGRALLAVHDYDNAATSLLWMPLLEPLDPPTTEASLQQAITALELSGRSAESVRLRAESSKTK